MDQIKEQSDTTISQPEISETENISFHTADKENGSWSHLLFNAATSLLIVIAIILIYHLTIVAPNKQRFGVVDLQDVLNIKQLKVAIDSSQMSSDDEKGARTFDEISRFTKEIEVALSEIQQECGCSLFVKAALIKAEAAEDFTPKLKQKLGLDSYDQASLMSQLRNIGGSGKAPLLENSTK